VREVASGTRCLDWVVPDEWTVRGARLLGPEGEVLADYAVNNLHLVGYSVPVQGEFSLEELQPHLHSRPQQPEAIPYVTSYYERNWGFCLADRVRQGLKPGRYRVEIDTSLEPGHLTYGEWILPGETEEELFFSTYICHPSMANNELSGPVVATWLARWLAGLPRLRHTIRLVLVPETVGSIVYLSRHLRELQERVKAGFVLTCMGDERAYSHVESRTGDTLADRVARHVLGHLHPEYVRYDYRQRGSDERNYCWPGVDLPVCSVMRTKYGRYPEYHTSLDDLSVITAEGLAGSLRMMQLMVRALEGNRIYRSTVLGEPQLGRRDLYPGLSHRDHAFPARLLVNVMVFSDGKTDLLAVAERVRKPIWQVLEAVETLVGAGLLEEVVTNAGGVG
jgi:aminopeptidase-like protein